MKAKYAVLSGIILLFVLLASCPLPTIPVNSGSLTISIDNAINSKTLLPPIDMNPSSYTVSGAGPNGATFSRSTSGGTLTVDSLAFGSWTITVTALNPGGTLIGSGTAAATVHTGETTIVAVSVTPLPGQGTLSLTVNWNAAQVERPSIVASLIPPTGTAVSLSFVVAGSQGTYSSSTIAAGYDTLSVQLLDNGIAVMGAVEVVRIVTGQETSGAYNFENVNSPGGSVVVNITPAMGDPIPVSISGVPATLSAGTNMTASASAGDGTGNVVWVWYLNGVSVGIGQTLTFGSTLGPGYYRLDATGFSADGTRAGSATAGFQVTGSSSQHFLWTAVTALGTGYWRSVALSSDGRILSAADRGSSWDPAGPGYIHTSEDRGVTWRNTSPQKPWGFVFLSSDGTKQLGLVDYYDYVYASNDSGNTWDHLSANQWFTAVGMTDDRQHIYTSAGNWFPYVSNDGGATWSLIGTQRTWWNRVVVAPDGHEAIVADSYSEGGNIFRSTDFGMSWIAMASAALKSWTDMTASVDLSRIFAVAYQDGIYTSLDHGSTWTKLSTVPADTRIRKIAGSGDCRRLVAASITGDIYLSWDFGMTWARDASAPTMWNPSIAMSRDGGTIIVGGDESALYIGRSQPGP